MPYYSNNDFSGDLYKHQRCYCTNYLIQSVTIKYYFSHKNENCGNLIMKFRILICVSVFICIGYSVLPLRWYVYHNIDVFYKWTSMCSSIDLYSILNSFHGTNLPTTVLVVVFLTPPTPTTIPRWWFFFTQIRMTTTMTATTIIPPITAPATQLYL